MDSTGLSRRGLFAAGASIMIPSPRAQDDAAAIIKALDTALPLMPMQPVAVSSRQIADLHRRARKLLLAGGLNTAQRRDAQTIAARIATINGELAGLAGHVDRAALSFAGAARITTLIDNPETVGMLARLRADSLIEAGRYADAVPVLERGLRDCPWGPLAAALQARLAHATAGVPGTDPGYVHRLAVLGVTMTLDLPDEQQQSLGLAYGGYHVADAADRAHSAMCLLGRVTLADQFAEESVPEFEKRGMIGFAAYSRLERAIAVLRSQGRMGIDESCALAAEAASIAPHRRTGELMTMARRWVDVAQPHGTVKVVQRTGHTMRLWRSGLLT